MNLKDKINDLLDTPDLAPETRALLRATLEAQETGKIPTDLTRFMEPEPTPGEWFINILGNISGSEDIPGSLVCTQPDRHKESMKHWPANAPILAAAKDMRDALSRLDRPNGVFAEVSEHWQIANELQDDIEFARAALAKAKKGGAE